MFCIRYIRSDLNAIDAKAGFVQKENEAKSPEKQEESQLIPKCCREAFVLKIS